MTDASSSIPCVRCGSPVPRSAQFCLVCGTPASLRTQAVALGGSGTSAADPESAAWQPAPVAEPMLSSTIVAARYGRRVLAYLIDGAIGVAVWLIAVVPLAALGAIRVDASSGSFQASGLSAVVVLVVALAYPVVLWVLQAFLGLTPGKASMRLRIVRRTTLARAGFGRILLRSLVVFAGSLVFGIGQLVVYLSPLWDARRIGQGWHDRAADTWVIDVRRGPNPLKAGPGQLVFDLAPSSAPSLPADPPATVASAFPGFTDPPPVISQFSARADPVIQNVPGFEPTPLPPAATREATVEPAPEPAPEPDVDSTHLSGPTGPIPAVPEVVSFQLDSGEVFPISGHGVLGRDPVPQSDAATVIRMPGDTLSVSKTHLEFGLHDGGVWVSDRGSTNGSAITRTDGTTQPLTPGARTIVTPGDRVNVGTRSFQVGGMGTV
jgi:uncharacterized RDD family membrane protein YckC